MVILSSPSVRRSRTAVAMMPARVSAGLAGRSRRLRGISERCVIQANLTNPGEAGRRLPQPPAQLDIPGGRAGLDERRVTAPFTGSVGPDVAAARQFAG